MEKLIIEAGRSEHHYWRDLWRHRELFYFLAWRDILVRYKQTAIGVLWSFVRPLLTMVIFTLFARFLAIPTEGIPAPVYILCALLPLQLFLGSFADAGNSLVANGNLISKVYFPRLIVPTGAVIVGLIDFLIAGIFLTGLMFWYGRVPDWRILTLPLFIGVALGASLGAGFLTAALTVRYRDFRVIVPFVVQLAFYASPVAYPSARAFEKLPEAGRLLYSLNPMVGVIDGFRWALFRGETAFYLPGFLLSLVVIGILLVLGTWYFRKTENEFADII